ncbi:MAG: exodeoxyribonuclease VII large subunit [Bryobacter sp.]|nr:exodeoxyribonuclease VII large subunit [Bryobacter sp.]
MSQLSLTLETSRLTVKEFTVQLRDLLRNRYSNLWIRGEISGLKTATSGHCYFNLKEENTILPCALFRQHLRLLRTPPREGMLVDVRGSIDVFEPRGAYQFLAEFLEPVGIGTLQQAFEALKQKLANEGLFAQERKRALPRFPRRIGIVTSPTGAVIQDMLNIFERRAPGLEIRLFPALVQGAGSKEDLCAGLEYFSSNPWADFVILARGGGSLEDLWSFNEESVARAIAACSLPVVSAVGHETDFTIADFVADLRAPTPSAAAEMTVPANQQILDTLLTHRRHMDRSLEVRLARLRELTSRYGVERPRALLERRLNTVLQQADEAELALRQKLNLVLKSRQENWLQLDRTLTSLSPLTRLTQLRHAETTLATQLDRHLKQHIAELRLRFSVAEARLSALSPKATLDRGYALVRTSAGRLVKNPAQAPAGTRLMIDLAEGQLSAQSLPTPNDSSELPS